MDLSFIPKNLPFLLLGAKLTVQLATMAIIFGIFLGLFAALGKISRNLVFSSIASFYVWAIRGTPLLFQILVTYNILPRIGLVLPAFLCGLIALSINSGAYIAEIIRAAILSIDRGQMEAARSLGMSYGQAMRRIIIPQAYLRLLPPLGNEYIALLKDSSLVSVIGLYELMRQSQQRVSATFMLEIFLITGALYLILTSGVAIIVSMYERKLGVYER